MDKKTTKNKGKIFEENVAKSAIHQGLYIDRLHDTDLSYNGNTVSKYTPKSRCDYYMFVPTENEMGVLFGLECKSTKYNSMSIEIEEDTNPTAMIKFHQIKSLCHMRTFQGIQSGFLMNFRDDENNLDDTYYMDVKKFIDFLTETGKKTINKTDCKMRAVKVQSELLRKNYRYNLKQMANDVIKEGVG